jgi:RecG-like helicase
MGCRTHIVKIKPGSDVTDGSQARQKVLERVSEELEKGGSVFWVFPLVDESEHFQEFGSAYQV